MCTIMLLREFWGIYKPPRYSIRRFILHVWWKFNCAFCLCQSLLWCRLGWWVNQRRSTTGFVVFLGSNPGSWQSKIHGFVSRSSTEAEYRSLANIAAEISWIRHILCDLHIRIPAPPLLKCDNLSALALCSNPVFHSRIKHLDNDFHFVWESTETRSSSSICANNRTNWRHSNKGST